MILRTRADALYRRSEPVPIHNYCHNVDIPQCIQLFLQKGLKCIPDLQHSHCLHSCFKDLARQADHARHFAKHHNPPRPVTKAEEASVWEPPADPHTKLAMTLEDDALCHYMPVKHVPYLSFTDKAALKWLRLNRTPIKA